MEREQMAERAGKLKRRRSSPPSSADDQGDEHEAEKAEGRPDGHEEPYPAPLTHHHFERVLQELPTGARLALQTCLSSWRNGNFSTDDFISFIKCYTCYSTTLLLVFGTMQMTGSEESPQNIDTDAVQCPLEDDVMQLSGDERSSSGGGGSEGDGRDVSEEVQGEVTMHQEHRHQTQPVCDSFHNVLSHDEMRRNMLRRQEARRRRLWGIDGPDEMKLGRYILRVLRDLGAQLTQDGKVRLHRLIAAYLADADATRFSKGINELVDEHQVVVELPYAMARNAAFAMASLPPATMARLPPIPPYATAKPVGYGRHLTRCGRDLVSAHDANSLSRDANNMPNSIPRHASHVPHALEQQEERAVERETQVAVETQQHPTHRNRICPGMLPGTTPMPPTWPNLTHATAISPAMHAPAAGAMGNVPRAASVTSVQAYVASASCKEGSGRQEDAGQEDGGREGRLWSAPSLWSASSEALQDTHLSVFMTKKLARVSPPCVLALVKVVADTRQVLHSSDRSPEDVGPILHSPLHVPQVERPSCRAPVVEHANGAAQEIGFRRRVVAVFTVSPVFGELLIFVMYVREYGSDCPDHLANSVCIECVDSTPLYSHEDGTQRQDLLTATMLAYLEWVKGAGFALASLHVPAPAQDKHYVFAYRSLNVRMRTCWHLANWYQRLLHKGMATGVVNYSYRTTSAHHLQEHGPLAEEAATSLAHHMNSKSSMHAIGERKSSSPSMSGTDSKDGTRGTDSTNGHSNSPNSSHSSSSGSGDDNHVTDWSNGDSDNGQTGWTWNSGTDRASWSWPNSLHRSVACNQHANGNQRGKDMPGRSRHVPGHVPGYHTRAGSKHKSDAQGGDDMPQGGDLMSHAIAARAAPGQEQRASLETRICFVAVLNDKSSRCQQQQGDGTCHGEALMPFSSIFANPSTLVKMLQREKLKFHSLKHAQAATRRLVEALLHQQRQPLVHQQQHPLLQGHEMAPLAVEKLAVNQKPNAWPHSAAWPWSPHTGSACMEGMYGGGSPSLSFGSPSLSPVSSVHQTAAGACVVGAGRSTGLALSGIAAGISAGISPLSKQALSALCNSPLSNSSLSNYFLSLASVGKPRASMPPGSLPNTGASGLSVLAGGMAAVGTPQLPARFHPVASFSFPAHSNEAGGGVSRYLNQPPPTSAHLNMPYAHLKVPSARALPFKPHTAYVKENTSAYHRGVLSDSSHSTHFGPGHAPHATPASAVSKLSQATQVLEQAEVETLLGEHRLINAQRKVRHGRGFPKSK